MVERDPRPLRRLVRDVPPVVLARARPPRHLQGHRGPAPVRRRRWGSTSSTCRRSTRSAGPSARGRTTPSPPAPTTPAAPGRSARPKGGTRRSTPNSARSTTSTAWSPRPRALGIEIALDIAFQCSPDHPYVREHPQWFRHRPDGTIKYAENPPKKYQDIYPIDFECGDWKNLYAELRDVFLFWVGHGVKHLPGRQPAHQAVPVLGVGDPRGLGPPPRHDLPGRGVHPPQADEAAGEGGLSAVVQLLHLAEQQAGPDRVFHRADPDRRRRVHAAEPVRQHARHPPRVPPVRRPSRVHGPARPGRDPGGDLRDLRAAVRALRRPGAAARVGGVPRLGEVPGPALGPRQPGEHPRLRHPGQRDPPREPRAARQPLAPVLRRPTTTRSSATARRRPTCRTSSSWW